MSTPPSTPAELKAAFMSVLAPQDRVDPGVVAAIDSLIDRIEDAYCGLVELTPIELMFGKSLFKLWEEENP